METVKARLSSGRIVRAWMTGHVSAKELRDAMQSSCSCCVNRLRSQFHRLDGPALEWSDGHKAWYVNGKFTMYERPGHERMFDVDAIEED